MRSDFRVSGQCLQSPIEPGGQCTFSITFPADSDRGIDTVEPLDLKLTTIDNARPVTGDRSILLLGGPPDESG